MDIVSKVQKKLREDSTASREETSSAVRTTDIVGAVQKNLRAKQTESPAQSNNLASWMNDVYKTSSRLGAEYKARDGKYQSAADYAAYRDANYAELDALLGKANEYRDYLRANEDGLDTATLKKMSDLARQYEGYINSAKSALDSEYNYWSQFVDERDYNNYIKMVEANEIEDGVRLKEERDAIVRQLERTGNADTKRLAELEEQIATLDLPGYNIAKGTYGAARKGVNQIAHFAASALAAGEDLLLSPFELLSGGELGAISDTAMMNKMRDEIVRQREDIDARFAANTAAGGKAAKAYEELMTATVAALPQALVGGAAAVPTSATLGATATASMSPSVANTVYNAASTMAKNPQYWLSFAQTVGVSYDQAIADMEASGEYDNNTIRTKAALQAIGSGLINAAIEIGGGIQTLPDELAKGENAWNVLVDSMVDEGREEVAQGIIERATQNLVYDKGNPLVSLSDENAVFSGAGAAKEFASGAAVGGLLGGLQIGANTSANKVAQRKYEKNLVSQIAEAQEIASLRSIVNEMNTEKETEAPKESTSVETLAERVGKITNDEVATLFSENAAEDMDEATKQLYVQNVAEAYIAARSGRTLADAKLVRDENGNYYGASQEIINKVFDEGLKARAKSVTNSIGGNAVIYKKDAGIDYSDAGTSEYAKTLNEKDVKTLNNVAKALGVKVRFADYGTIAKGKANAEIENGIITIEKHNENPLRFLFGHEITHRMQELAPAEYDRLRAAIESRDGIARRVALTQNLAARDGDTLSYEAALDEVVADEIGMLLEDTGELERFIRKHSDDRTMLEKLRDIVKDLRKKLSQTQYAKRLREADKLLSDALNKSVEAVKQSEQTAEVSTAAEKVNVEIDAESESAAPTRQSRKTWNNSEYVKERDAAAKDMAKALNITEEKAKAYIDSVNSIAKIIADDHVRLDYEASPGRSSFVGNTEYGGSIDFSTICKKRRLFTGTFEAIQNALPNTALTANEILEIRKMMDDKGYEVSCGLCYVEGSRANMGRYAKQFIEEYSKTSPDYIPNMAEINTPNGLEKIRMERPEVYAAYESFMNKLAQRKPKLYQMQTEYNGEILDKFRGKSVEEKNRNGGMRMQSFSDFEIIHLIDCMQVIMDMSRVGLAGQAYTKVPDFAWALGGTGLKINLSLIAKGVDKNGKLILDEKEGMSLKDAMSLRNTYSENVGTIVVVFTDVQLKAAMADERIDYIIPFHRSQWNKGQYAAMGLPQNAKDFTSWQNESFIEAVYNKNGKKLRPANYMPNEYWDFNKSGKENAEQYLRMCAENNRRPKFHYLLVNNGDGSYSLQPDGSTDGYWKTLIDFKMYDNNGVGSPQMPVRPDFNMERAERMLKEYTGGHSSFPVAQDIVDEFVDKYKNEHKGAKYSRKDASGLTQEIARIQREGKELGHSDAEIQAEIRAAVEEAYSGMVDEFGAMEAGENPYRESNVPKRTAKKEKVSKMVRTIVEAEATPEVMLPAIEQLVAEGTFSYNAYTDEKAIADAERTIAGKGGLGWAKAYAEWSKAMDKGEVSKANTAMGWVLYNNAANSGDVQTAIDILDKMVEHQRNAAQALQATRILKKLSPDAQLYGAQRSVANLTRELKEKYGEKVPDLKIDTELAEKFLRARTDEGRAAAMRDIYRDIGRQMPSRFVDKWNAWRYLSMLGNPRTHIRNIVGNAFFAPVVVTKNVVATGIESAVSAVAKKKGVQFNRSKAAVGIGKNDKAVLSAAWNDYSKVQETMSGGKYSDFANANKNIEEGRRIFKTKPLEALRRGNSAALEAEDAWFSKPQYAYALSQYCKANGISAKQIESGKGMDAARKYAINEALKATYRDTNALSQTISGFLKTRSNDKGARIVNTLSEGILPFRKTPANILARGIEYSPLGLMNGIKQAVWDVQRGTKTGAEAIDSISAGLTGTGLFALGLYLAAECLVRGHGSGDEDENEFEELMGKQAYSLELPNGTSVTLDWLAPECLPFFVGVNLWEQTHGANEELTFSAMLDAVTTVSEPLLEMSCLQSLNDVFDAVGYVKSNGFDGLPAAISKAATSYLTQGLPTILGQAERSGESYRMTTYTEKNAFLTNDMQYALGKASSRIPGVDYQQIPYIDAWGRKEQTGNVFARSFNNFINPAYVSSVDESAMEKELLRLYEKTGEASVFPSRGRRYFSVDGVRKDLTADEYVKYATALGTRSMEIVTALTKSSAYKAMSDADKVKAIQNAYDFANQEAKAKVSAYKTEKWVANAKSAKAAYGIKIDTFAALRAATSGIESLRDENGDTIADSQSLLKMEAVYAMPGLTDEQRKAMFVYLGVGKSVRNLSEKSVAKKLEQMRKRAE